MTVFESGTILETDFPEPNVVKRMRKLRAERRYTCNIYAHAIQDGFEVPCTVLDISAGGAQVRFDALSTSSIYDKPMALSIPKVGQYPASFRWRSGPNAGLVFNIAAQNRLALRARLLDKFDPI